MEMKRPYVGISAILMKKDKVLLGKRKGSHGQGTWSFPGGHLGFNEGFCTCLNREIFEETGLKEGNFRLIDSYPVKATNDIFMKEGKHYVTLFMRVEHLYGAPFVKEKDKCEKWDWFYWNNLPSPLFLPVKNLTRLGFKSTSL